MTGHRRDGVTDSEKIQEWLRCFENQISDEAKLSMLNHLRRESRAGNRIAREALSKAIKLWLEE